MSIKNCLEIDTRFGQSLAVAGDMRSADPGTIEELRGGLKQLKAGRQSLLDTLEKTEARLVGRTTELETANEALRAELT